MKIQMLDEATIVLGNGATIHIAESTDGNFNIDIQDYRGDGVRIGVEEDGNVHYIYWKDIQKKLNELNNVIENTMGIESPESGPEIE